MTAGLRFNPSAHWFRTATGSGSSSAAEKAIVERDRSTSDRTGGGAYAATMTAVLVTGMSGAGKSTALAELARRGHRVVDTDYGDWSEDVQPAGEAGSEQLWREDRMDALLAEPAGGTLFISGCVANQVKFYPRFHAIVLLSAPTDVILDRVASRRTNDYGKTHAERALILHHIRTIEPLLRVGATAESTPAGRLTRSRISWSPSPASRGSEASPSALLAEAPGALLSQERNSQPDPRWRQ